MFINKHAHVHQENVQLHPKKHKFAQYDHIALNGMVELIHTIQTIQIIKTTQAGNQNLNHQEEMVVEVEVEVEVVGD